MGPATIGYMIGAFVGALFFTGIVVAVSRSIRSSLTKLFVAVAVLTVLSIVAEYYGSADGAPVEFPPPLGWFLGFEASLRLATFGAAFLVFSVPVLTGFWKSPSEAQETFGTSNLRMSRLAIPIALASFVPLGWFLYENRPPENGLELYEEIAPRTLALLDDINPTFRSQAEEAIGVHRLSSGVSPPPPQVQASSVRRLFLHCPHGISFEQKCYRLYLNTALHICEERPLISCHLPTVPDTSGQGRAGLRFARM